MPARCRLIAIVLAVASCGRVASAKEGFEGWNLEPSVGQAHLILVARVAGISRVTVVEGAKTDIALREFRFQPIRRLKGIFQRDELSMTASDLGIAKDDVSTAPPLNEGEYRLLILAQQGGMTSFGGIQSFGCVSAAPGATTFEQRVPLLTGPDDPLVGVVETLIRVADSRSRRERAEMLIERLADVDGVAAVPLLASLRLRADWAATNERAYAPLVRLAGVPLAAIRGGALDLLRDMLASRVAPDDAELLDSVAKALRSILESDESNSTVRLSALDALGHLLAIDADIDGAARDLLIAQMTAAATYAERAAAATALSQFPEMEVLAPLLDAFAKLPLDEPATRESVYARAIMRFLPDDDRRRKMGDLPAAERALINRLQRSMAARQSLEAEIVALGRMRSKESVPLLLAAADQLHASSANADRHYLAWALGQLRDDRAVPVLVDWLRSDDYQAKEAALTALEAIDSPAAAREARPLLKSEAYLPFKLRLARLLARHDMADGYALATEHLSDNEHTARAALVLAALDDPRTSRDLSEILEARPDRRWHAAALVGLAAIGDAAARKEMLEILADERHPLATDAATAAGLADDGELLAPLASLVPSRNKQLALASLAALRRFLSDIRSSPRGLVAAEDDDDAATDPGKGESAPRAAMLPAETRAALAKAVASLAVDAYVDPNVRREALAVARLLGGERYTDLLSDLADQAELEGTPLLEEVQTQRRWLQGRAEGT
jgi:HEAT repeat protein